MRQYYRAKHILLEDEEDALEILECISRGEDFESLAKKFSECDSANDGGHLGRFATGTMDPEFERALYNMEEGELKGPVKTKFGYHIIVKLSL
jgi:peptidyl-prolyl cis-trans isomerase C